MISADPAKRPCLELDECTSDEDKRVRKRVGAIKASANPTSVPIDPADIEMLISLGLGDLIETPVLTAANLKSDDLFTCFIQQTVASVLFGHDLPEAPPSKNTDTPAMYQDKTLLGLAIRGGFRFMDETLVPLYERVRDAFGRRNPAWEKVMHHLEAPDQALVMVPKLEGETTCFLSAEPLEPMDFSLVFQSEPHFTITCRARLCNLIVDMHAIFHLKMYVASAIRDARVPNDATFCSTWHWLAKQFASKPVNEWLVLTDAEVFVPQNRVQTHSFPFVGKAEPVFVARIQWLFEAMEHVQTAILI